MVAAMSENVLCSAEGESAHVQIPQFLTCLWSESRLRLRHQLRDAAATGQAYQRRFLAAIVPVCMLTASQDLSIHPVD